MTKTSPINLDRFTFFVISVQYKVLLSYLEQSVEGFITMTFSHISQIQLLNPAGVRQLISELK